MTTLKNNQRLMAQLPLLLPDRKWRTTSHLYGWFLSLLQSRLASRQLAQTRPNHVRGLWYRARKSLSHS